MARRSVSSFSSLFLREMSCSTSPACDASPWLNFEICLRRFSFSTSRSASGLRFSIPPMKSPKNPLMRFPILLNI